MLKYSTLHFIVIIDKINRKCYNNSESDIKEGVLTYVLHKMQKSTDGRGITSVITCSLKSFQRYLRKKPDISADMNHNNIG